MSKNVKKIIKEYDEAEQKIKFGKQKVQYKCDHQKRPHVTAFVPTDSKTLKDAEGKPLKAYQCEKCNKLIRMNAPTNREADEAMNNIETMSDYMRSMTDSSTEKGAATCEWHANFLMDLNKFVKAYKAIRGEQEKRSQKKRNQNGSHSVATYEG